MLLAETIANAHVFDKAVEKLRDCGLLNFEDPAKVSGACVFQIAIALAVAFVQESDILCQMETDGKIHCKNCLKKALRLISTDPHYTHADLPFTQAQLTAALTTFRHQIDSITKEIPFMTPQEAQAYDAAYEVRKPAVVAVVVYPYKDEADTQNEQVPGQTRPGRPGEKDGRRRQAL